MRLPLYGKAEVVARVRRMGPVERALYAYLLPVAKELELRQHGKAVELWAAGEAYERAVLLANRLRRKGSAYLGAIQGVDIAEQEAAFANRERELELAELDEARRRDEQRTLSWGAAGDAGAQ